MPRIASIQPLLKHAITESCFYKQRLSLLWNLICEYYWPICTSNCMISAAGTRHCLLSMLLTTTALRKPWGNGFAHKTPGALPMIVCVIPVGSVPLCSGLQRYATAARSGISAMSGTAHGLAGYIAKARCGTYPRPARSTSGIGRYGALSEAHALPRTRAQEASLIPSGERPEHRVDNDLSTGVQYTVKMNTGARATGLRGRLPCRRPDEPDLGNTSVGRKAHVGFDAAGNAASGIFFVGHFPTEGVWS